MPFKNLLCKLPLVITISLAFFGSALGDLKSSIQVSEISIPIPKPNPNIRFEKKTRLSVYHQYELAITLAENGEWNHISKLNRGPVHEGLDEVLLWLNFKVQGSKYKFSSIKSFLARQPIWPERKDIILRGESLVDHSIPPSERDKWFLKYRPQTSRGKLEWIKTLETLNEIERRDSLILKTWLNTQLTRQIQSRLHRVYPDIIDKNANWARLDNFLWQGRTRSAQKMYPLVNKDLRLLSEARLRLRYMMGGVDDAINRVPI